MSVLLQSGRCDTKSAKKNFMGFPASPEAEGDFYLRTNSRPPYAILPPANTEEKKSLNFTLEII